MNALLQLIGLPAHYHASHACDFAALGDKFAVHMRQTTLILSDCVRNNRPRP